MTTRPNTNLRNTMVDSLNGTFAVFRVYTGTQPATADTAPTGILLSIIDMVNGYTTSLDGTAILAAAETGTGVVTGTAGWGRMLDAGGTHWVDGTVGVQGSGADFILDTINIIDGEPVSLINASLTMPAG